MLNEEELLSRVKEVIRLDDKLRLVKNYLAAHTYNPSDIRTMALEVLKTATMEELDRKLAP